MRGIEWSGERDDKAILAKHIWIAEALEQHALIVVEIRAGILRSLDVARWGGEILECGHALSGKPLERRLRLDGTQHERSAGARQRQGSGLDRLAPRCKIDDSRFYRIDTHTIAQRERCPERRMQTGVAPRRSGDLSEPRSSKT